MITGSQQQLQEVLSLFGGSTAVGLAAKESALTNLVMLVADNMYTPALHPSLQVTNRQRYRQSRFRHTNAQVTWHSMA